MTDINPPVPFPATSELPYRAHMEAIALDAIYVREIDVLRETINQLLYMAKMHGDDSRHAGALSALILQLREANQHLVLATIGAQDRQVAAEDAHQRQTEFLAMLAHELRNPLQPMAMANALLSKVTDLDPAIALAHSTIGRQVDHLASLVDDLSDASRAVCGKIVLQRRPIALADVVTSAVETTRAAMAKLNQVLVINVTAALFVNADESRLTQVFVNLLANASKFTHEHGHITVTVQRHGDTAQVSVADDGAGVPLDIQPFIFDLFTQGSRSLDRVLGGLGVGLSLVRAIAHLHGGTVDMSSAGVGLGSRFVVTLPLFSARKALVIGANATSVVAQSRRVLLIEDNYDASKMLAMLLIAEGHAVTTCFDGPSGLRAGSDHPFDVVICDIGLPGMNGYQVVSALRAATKGPLPIFIATVGYNPPGFNQRGYPNVAEAGRGSESGFDHYLTKPISIAALARIIAQIGPARAADPRGVH